ncbi:MAG TPA: c(7)-type cytochrome triheme domain-containing protein [Burkholderiales bacterium]|nr:c(7)-type cytochrome triheme domain-containing protein [Burkholderiales bacterium]
MSSFLLPLATLLGLALALGAAGAGEWAPLEADGLHDPTSPAIKLLQQPREALSKLAPDSVGNQVRWVDALDRGQIKPRTNIFPETKVRVLDQDIILNKRGSLPLVLFPHRLHTAWLDCSICHEQLFKAKAGANKFSMLQILSGEQCGLCHGAVAFPLTECGRCHRVPNGAPAATKRAQ